ncbi:hypothetical protein LTR16_002299 [Cryomyces antarcticus]|uniref:F-box domain-containing protein n=1 Tax=Cryomyces antarcticus TaxID=329879 RepID=A0ABR0KTB3_9PEZI|nr:hypothetical protein LTR16_002299 [Cryomyces antarcticus]
MSGASEDVVPSSASSPSEDLNNDTSRYPDLPYTHSSDMHNKSSRDTLPINHQGDQTVEAASTEALSKHSLHEQLPESYQLHSGSSDYNGRRLSMGVVTIPRRDGNGRRISFHRVLTALFNAVHATPLPSTTGYSTRHTSSKSINTGNSHGSETVVRIVHTPRSRNEAIVNSDESDANFESTMSLELVSPGTFIFSGPNLRGSGSSYSLLPRINSGVEFGAASAAFRRSGAASFYTVTNDSFADSVLEPPCQDPLHNSSSLYEVVSRTSSAPEILSEDGFPSHMHQRSALLPGGLATVSLIPSPRPAPALPAAVMGSLLSYLTCEEIKAVRLTCRSWSSALTFILAPQYPTAHRLPTEIIQQIYVYLAPVDFNAARHTCRTWMLASLNTALLRQMCKRGGWWTAAERDLENLQARNEVEPNYEWLTSRRISRECALEPGWTGNGIREAPFQSFQHPHRPSAIALTAATDFADLSSGYAGLQGRHNAGLIFTVSVCGGYVLVAEGGIVYVYAINGKDIRPITSVVCPKRVLAVSMDASSKRFAIAALLDGRMGLVCDLTMSTTPKPEKKNSQWETAAALDVASSPGAPITALEPGDMVRTNSERWYTEKVSLFTSRYPRNERTSISGHDKTSHDGDPAPDRRSSNHAGTSSTVPYHKTSNFIPSNDNEDKEESVSVSAGPRSLYRHLCSDDDPPRSVAICPSRRCVAFGCSAGIELHWVDALTGQDMNRWFPLTAPSDFLYFLPPRRGVDSAKKLRLVSSAAHTTERPAIRSRFYRRGTGVSSLWGNLGLHSHGSNSGSPRGSSPNNHDHYRAVPLSDGYHILFTDPKSNLLCLGSDAPLGGPTKLLRKMMFVPLMPSDSADKASSEGADSNSAIVPALYAAAADVSQGVRVVAVYGESIVLYSVPPDVFAHSMAEQGSKVEARTNPPPYNDATSDDTTNESNLEWLRWWPDHVDSCGHAKEACIWPLKVRGILVGAVSGLVDLAISCSPVLTIWGFSLDGRASTWQVDTGHRPLVVSHKVVAADGTIHSVNVDADSDVSRADAGTDDEERSVGFDGCASALFQRPDATSSPDALVNNGHTTYLLAPQDVDGDVIMSN